MEIFLEISAVLILTTAVSFLMRLLKQPLVVGYILSGIVVGPTLLNLVHSHSTLELFAKFGITTLLFIVGLHLSPQVIKEVGKVSVITGLGQVVFTSLFGLVIALFLGFSLVNAIYIAIALTFSSTIIILKLLSDKNAVQTLYGKISIGFLLVQDIVAAIILIVVSSVGANTGLSVESSLLLMLFKGFGLLAVLFSCTQWLLPQLLAYASKQRELLFLFSLTWGVAFASLFYILGLSVEIGALIAGVSLSSSAFAEEISARLRPLRDFFIILFFILLGSEMTFAAINTLIIPVMLFSLFVLIGNPLIVVIIMNLLGYHRKTGFFAGLTVAQISEFSLILVALGSQVGHVSAEVITILTLVGLVTIAGSTYMILYADQLYSLFNPVLKLLELRKPQNKKLPQNKLEVLLFGYDKIGQQFLQTFKKLEYKAGVIDFNPEIIEELSSKKIKSFFGDVANIEFLNELPIESTKMIISSLSSIESNILLLKNIKERKSRIITLFFSKTKEDAVKLYEAGASYVIVSHHIGAKHAMNLITKSGFRHKHYSGKRAKHKKELEKLFTL